MMPRVGSRPRPGVGSLLKAGAARLFPRAALVRGTTTRPEVAITFDDGPHPVQTPRLLETLAREGAQATFFLQGDHAERFPGCVRDIHAAGHQIANHSYSHIKSRERAASIFVAEIERTHALLEDLVGCRLARDYRPPYGNITPRTFTALAARGYRSVFWSVDSCDSSIVEPAALASHVATLQIGAGDIVLFHEDYGHTHDAMPSILAGLRDAGLALRRLDQLATGNSAAA